MKTANKLYEVIEHTIDSFDKIENFDRETVFNELLKFSNTVSNREDIFKMLFVFNKYKKILHFLRNGDMVLAEYNLKYLIDKNINYSNDLSKTSMDSLYFPIVAYYYYKKNDYLSAKINLDKSYSEFDKLYHRGYKNVIFNFVEQKVNEFRILINQKQYSESILLIEELFSNIISDKNFYHFDCVFENLCSDDEELISYINYILDICNPYLIIDKDRIKVNDIYSLEFVKKLREVFFNYRIKSLIISLDALNLILKDNTKDFLSFVTANSNTILDKNLACSLAYVFYKIILLHIHSNAPIYDRSINLFSEKKNFDSYKCFIEKLLQDEMQNTKICAI